MPCQEIKNSSLSTFTLGNPLSSLNTPPGGSGVPQTRSAYICDRPEEVPGSLSKTLLASPLLGKITPTGLSPLLKSVALFAPKTTAPSLPPPPSSPLARTLYDLTTQLENFELNASLKLPMDGVNDNGTVQTFSRAVLKDKGALVLLSTQFQPALGPQAIVKVLDQVPILGIFFRVRVLQVEMDPSTRKLKAHVKWLCVPITQQVHDDYLKKADLPPDLIKGPGYDLTQGLPVYSWQILDLVLKIIERKGEQVAKNVGVDGVKPKLDQSEIVIEGDFSNKTVNVGGLQLEFAPLAPSEKHRIRLAGSLLNPLLTVNGLQSAELQGSKGRLRLVNAESPLEPLQIQIKVDPLGTQPTQFTVPHYQSKKVFLETVPNDPSGSSLRLNMDEGIEIQGLTFRNESDGLHVDMEKLITKRISFEGQGLEFKTAPGDQATFEDVHVKMANGQPEFFSKIRTKATGELRYSREGEELGFLKFQSLEGTGTLRVGPDAQGKFRIQVEGNVSAQIPELGFVVKSDKIKASVQTKVENAMVNGVGRLQVWPDDRSALVESLKEGQPLTVQGQGGQVIFHQDPSQIAAWPELKKELGDLPAQKVVTHLLVQPKLIEFSVQKMNLKTDPQNGEKPSLEIAEADLSQIHIQGDVWGQLFTRLPGGVYLPILIPQQAMLKDAVMKVGRLKDQTGTDGKRSALFNQIVLEGVESQPTFSKKDQKRCGIDRQHIHATLGLFQFTEDRQVRIERVDPHFHIFLKNQVGGGCLKIE